MRGKELDDLIELLYDAFSDEYNQRDFEVSVESKDSDEEDYRVVVTAVLTGTFWYYGVKKMVDIAEDTGNIFYIDGERAVFH